MRANQNTFRTWILKKVQTVLTHKPDHTSLVIWCDPARHWKELLETTLKDAGIELWGSDGHELALRHRFYSEPPGPRVIWLPVDRQEIGYFLVYALQADQIIQQRLTEALDAYGVDLPSDQIQSLEPILPAHALQWIDYPLSFWKEKFSTGQVTGSLISDELILNILAAPGKKLSEWITSDRLQVLNRRVVDDFGLPPLVDGPAPSDPDRIDTDLWRVRAAAALLVTEADEAVPVHPPGDRDRVIQSAAARGQSLKLLANWQKQFDLVDAFQELAAKADGTTSLQYWARNLPEMPPPLSSPVVETVRFQLELENLAKLVTFDEITAYLAAHAQAYREHAASFWGKRAKECVKWSFLVELSENSAVLKQHAAVEKNWQTLQNAADWYVQSGWRVDWTGEQLFRENNQLPGALVGARAQLRHAYLRHLDRVNTAFADLITHQSSGAALPFDYTGSLACWQT